MGLHLWLINAKQRIANNIVITATDDSYLKGIYPIFRKLYLSFKKNEGFKNWLISINSHLFAYYDKHQIIYITPLHSYL